MNRDEYFKLLETSNSFVDVAFFKPEFLQVLCCQSLPDIEGVCWCCAPLFLMAGHLVSLDGRHRLDLALCGRGKDGLDGQGGPGQHVEGAGHQVGHLHGQLL